MLRKGKIQKELLKKVDDLNYTLTKNNILEFAELLGNRKELIIRNLLTRYIKGNWNRNWFYYFNSNFINSATKNRYIKYTCHRRLYFRYCRNCRK